MNGNDKIIVLIEGPDGSQQVTMTKSTFVLGHGALADIDLGIETIAPKQTRITFTGGELWAEELCGQSGTWLNGKRLTPGKRIRISSTDRLTFKDHELAVSLAVIESQQIFSELLVANGASFSIPHDPGFREEKPRSDLTLVEDIEEFSARDILHEEYEACHRRLAKSLEEERRILESLRLERAQLEEQDGSTSCSPTLFENQISPVEASDLAGRLAELIQRQLLVNHGRFIDDSYLKEFRTEALILFQDELLGKDTEDSLRLKARHQKLAEAKRIKQRLFRGLNVFGITASFLFLALFLRPDLAVRGRTSLTELFAKKRYQNAEEFARRKITTTRQRLTYTPATTPDLKPSFHENVLFTTDFLPKFRKREFQDKWIVDLNDFFIHRLDVKDTTIIRYVSLEANFLIELEKLKASVDPRNPAPKIAQMKTLEQEFKNKLATIFEDPDKVATFYEYHQGFWKDFYPSP